MRIILVIVTFTVLFTAPLLIFGDRFDVALSGDAAAARLRNYGDWAWAVGMGLIVADLVLPIPATAVMGALGYLHGAMIGGLISGLASFLAGLIAYGATRLIGRRAAIFIVGERDLHRARDFFARRGGYAVAVSRALPLLPEVVACTAGLAGMRLKPFLISLGCGSLPTGLIYAAIGAIGVDRPIVSLAAGCLIPVALWAVVRNRLR